MRRIEKPKEAEYAPYAIQYIGLLPDDGLVLEHLQKNLEATRAFLRSLPEDKLWYRYAADKWTVREIVLHIADDERIYTRLCQCARQQRQPRLLLLVCKGLQSREGMRRRLVARGVQQVTLRGRSQCPWPKSRTVCSRAGFLCSGQA